MKQLISIFWSVSHTFQHQSLLKNAFNTFVFIIIHINNIVDSLKKTKCCRCSNLFSSPFLLPRSFFFFILTIAKSLVNSVLSNFSLLSVICQSLINFFCYLIANFCFWNYCIWVDSWTGFLKCIFLCEFSFQIKNLI